MQKNMREEIKIKRIHDAELWILTNSETEEADKERINEIYKKIIEAKSNAEKEINSLPEIEKARLDYLQKAEKEINDNITKAPDLLERIKKDRESLSKILNDRKESLESDIKLFDARIATFKENCGKYLIEPEKPKEIAPNSPEEAKKAE